MSAPDDQRREALRAAQRARQAAADAERADCPRERNLKLKIALELIGDVIERLMKMG